VDDNEERGEKPPLADWATMVQPASLSTKTGGQRFVITIKLPEKSLKTASSFVTEMNSVLKPDGQFVLVDTERVRLQRATASFSTFKEAQACLSLLKELGLPTNPISVEFEDFGKKKYDPWHERISKAWWPWLAACFNPPPEMPLMKVTNRLDLTAGSKYKESASGKLGHSAEVDRADAQRDAPAEEDETSGKDKPRREEPKPRRKKKKKKADDGE